MMNGLYLAAMGAKVQDARADVVANNLANLNTVGFRRDEAVFRQRLAAELERPERAGRGEPRYESVGGGVFLARISSVAEPGPLEQTGRSLDLAIDGEGFLKVRSADGSLYYTRAGNLRRNEEGFLVTGDGKYRVQGAGGGDIQIPAGRFDIGEAGEIYVDGLQEAQIGVLMPSDPAGLVKRGDSLWTAGTAGAEVPATGKLRQGFLEESPVEPMREMAEMIGAQRSYEMNMRALRIQDEILARAVSDIGRSTPS